MDAWAPPQVSGSKSHGKGPESYFKRSPGLLKLPGWGPRSRHQWFWYSLQQSRWSDATLLGILGRTKVFFGQPGGIPHHLVPGPPACFLLGARGLLYAPTRLGLGVPSRAPSAGLCFFFFATCHQPLSKGSLSHIFPCVPSWLLPLLWLQFRRPALYQVVFAFCSLSSSHSGTSSLFGKTALPVVSKTLDPSPLHGE